LKILARDDRARPHDRVDLGALLDGDLFLASGDADFVPPGVTIGLTGGV
jgi:hypothetical protein